MDPCNCVEVFSEGINNFATVFLISSVIVGSSAILGICIGNLLHWWHNRKEK